MAQRRDAHVREGVGVSLRPEMTFARAARSAVRFWWIPIVIAVAGGLAATQVAGASKTTYSATGQVSAPILQIAKVHGDEQVAAAQYDQTKAKLSDQVQQVNQEVRDAILDIQSAAKLVDATKSNVQLANEALSEAQQRFRVGVSDNLPVSQALSQFEQANDQYISALYQHNVAKLSLARALGVTSTNYKDYLGGK